MRTRSRQPYLFVRFRLGVAYRNSELRGDDTRLAQDKPLAFQIKKTSEEEIDKPNGQRENAGNVKPPDHSQAMYTWLGGQGVHVTSPLQEPHHTISTWLMTRGGT